MTHDFSHGLICFTMGGIFMLVLILVFTSGNRDDQ